MKKLIIIQIVAPDYRNLFFKTLKKELGSRFELYAGKRSFEKTVKTDSKINKDLKNHFLFNRKIIFQTKIWHLLFKKDVVVMELNPRNLTTWFFLIIRKITQRPTVIWGHAWPRAGKESKSDIIRNLMRKLAFKIIVYTNQQKKELQKKMPQKHIFAAPNAVYTKEMMLTELDENTINLIYVGRLVKDKKVEFLVKAFHYALDSIPAKANLFIVGDGDKKNIIQNYIVQNNLEKRIKMLGHINDYKRLKELYKKSLFSISPGYIGLSVTQSFSFGVPMLVSKNENHSPEIEAVIDKENALFFDTDNKNDFKDKVINIYKEKDYWLNQRKNIVTFCKNKYSTQAMAKPFIDLIH
jgi:glycosyltransferase involved in cell wall biosynthesis